MDCRRSLRLNLPGVLGAPADGVGDDADNNDAGCCGQRDRRSAAHELAALNNRLTIDGASPARSAPTTPANANVRPRDAPLA